MMLCRPDASSRRCDMAKVWKIRGFDGDRLTFEREIPLGSLSELEMETLLQRLAARHLTDGEVVGASLRRGSAGYRYDFEIARNTGGLFALMTPGSGMHYTATVEET